MFAFDYYRHLRHNIGVIGATNIDIQVNANNLVESGSTHGTVKFTLGGVARNIVENLSNMQLKVFFVTALRREIYSFFPDCFDKKYVSVYSRDNCKPSIFVNLCLDGKEYGVNSIDNSIISPNDISGAINEINNCSIVVLDLNLPEDSLQYIVINCKARLVCEATSILNCRKVLGIGRFIDVLNANYHEACLIADVMLGTSYIELIRRLSDIGINKCFITLGSKGAIAVDYHKILWYQTKYLNTPVTVGAGDAFVSGVIYGIYHNWDISDTLEYGLVCAYYRLKSGITVTIDSPQELNVFSVITKKSSWNNDNQEWI